ncbi:hypothetical protein QI124_11150 [Staphylococcus saprophyticus]|nr:hypothetical protein [Staphylococcus saprophyticus]MDW4428668.1 hypothetical protein [Staphylococcus saprophyticus]
MSDNVLPIDDSVALNTKAVGTTVNDNTLLSKNDIIEIKKATIEALMEYEKRTLDLGGSKIMSEHVKREEYENFKNHLDTKFDRIIDKLDENRRETKNDILASRQEIKDDLNEFQNRTLTVFGLAVSVVGIIVPIILHFI